MRDMDLAVRATDDKRPEVVVDGLPLFGESQLARPSCVRYIATVLRTLGSCSRDGALAEGATLPRIGWTSIGGARKLGQAIN